MLTSEDIQKIIEAEKEIFPSKNDFVDLRGDFHKLQTSVDNYAKKADLYHQELAVLVHKITRMEDWIRKAATKLGIEFGL